MSVDVHGLEFHNVPREMLHDGPLAQGIEKLQNFPIPGESNHLLVTATSEEGMVGIARLDFRPGGWLGKIVLGLDPELNGEASQVIERMTEKLRPKAIQLGMTALDVVERVKRKPGDGLGPMPKKDENPYGEKPLKRVGL